MKEENYRKMVMYRGVCGFGSRFYIFSYEDLNSPLEISYPCTIVRYYGDLAKELGINKPHIIRLYQDYESIPASIVEVYHSFSRKMEDNDPITRKIHEKLIEMNRSTGKEKFPLGLILREIGLFSDDSFCSRFTVSRNFNLVIESFAELSK